MIKKLLIFCLIVLMGMSFWIYSDISKGIELSKLSLEKKCSLKIPKGAGWYTIASKLKREGTLGSNPFRVLYFKYLTKSLRSSPKPGKYSFADTASKECKDLTFATLFQILEKGVARKQISVTIPEGFNMFDIAHLLEKKGVLNAVKFIVAASDKEKSKERFGSKTGFEGYLYPDTYKFHTPSSPDEVIERMLSRFEEKMSPAFWKKAQSLGLDMHSVLTLASLVEKETSQKSERSHISRVYLNRIKKNMKMQCDPTIIYAQLLTHGEFGGNIKRSHIRFVHPYNTYSARGLPPGPIANPSAETMKDTVNPIESEDLFFVSKNDGFHIFCPTYDCHKKNVKKWQIDYFRKKRNQSKK